MASRVCRTLRDLCTDRRGATAILIGFIATVLIGFAGLAIDVTAWEVAHHTMQGAADQAAYSAVVAGGGANGVTEAKAIAANLGYVNGQNGVKVTVNQPPAAPDPNSSNSNAIQVIVSQPQPRYFSALFLSSAPTVSAQAVARASGAGACIIALATTGPDNVNVTGSGTVLLQNCDLYDNSSDPKGLQVQGGSATLDVEDAYIVGGYNATAGSFNVSKTLKIGASVVADPYASRTAPTIGACGSNPTNPAGGGSNGNYTSPSSATTIYPGVYCGTLAAGGPLTLSPGVYIIAGGSFNDQGGSSGDPVLSGGVCTSPDGKPYVNATGGVTIYLGPNSSGNFGSVAVGSCLSITAPTSGNTAGIAFWENAAAPNNLALAFNGGSNVAITGVIYAPSEAVDYTGSAIATSGCTQIVAGAVWVNGSANFQHNCAGVGISDVTGGSSGGGPPKLVE